MKMLDMSKFNMVPLEMKKAKKYRCILCGKDVEKLYAGTLRVNSKDITKIQEIAISFPESNLFINSMGSHTPEIDGVVDDLNLKPIRGTSFEISIDMCFDCLDKLGFRHKFKRKHIKKMFATKRI